MESDESQDSSVEETDEIDDMEGTEENDDTRYTIQILIPYGLRLLVIVADIISVQLQVYVCKYS